ncbi:MAG: hypothetical protein JWM68_5219, partial [Verrucomicrobiales bacterium]|nr:hypothetical protein [Verrucomicrobiales bacterium]
MNGRIVDQLSSRRRFFGDEMAVFGVTNHKVHLLV